MMSNTLLHALALIGPLASDVKRDEVVVFFETWAWQEPADGHWMVPIHGWIFEPEHDSIVRAALLSELSDALDVDEMVGSEAEDLLLERARYFLVDNERGKRIAVRLGDEVYALPDSQENGHFQGMLRVPGRSVSRPTTRPSTGADWVRFEAVLPQGDGRSFGGAVLLMEPRGLSVVSDIDDTIRVSQVLDHRTALQRAFLRPFEAVEGMAAVYRHWAKAGATFHWVSDSPWQLYPPLKGFMAREGFPDGTFALKPVRLKDSSFFNLFDEPAETKPPKIEPLLKTFPQRRFIFVGDSGQKDPEIYGDLARRYPEQVIGIFIRNVTDEPGDSPRYQQAFNGIPADRWMVFHQAWEIEEAAQRVTRPFSHLRTGHPVATSRESSSPRP